MFDMPMKMFELKMNDRNGIEARCLHFVETLANGSFEIESSSFNTTYVYLYIHKHMNLTVRAIMKSLIDVNF